MFFYSPDLFVCSFKKKYSLLFLPLCQSFSVEAPCILHALPSQTVFDFLSQRHNKLCHFISDIMDFLLKVNPYSTASDGKRHTDLSHHMIT